MIVLDEGIYDPDIARRIAVWYPGRVVSVTALRPRTVVKDDAVALLLRTAQQPTFITINVSDFGRVIDCSIAYAIICIDLPIRQASEIPDWLRRCLQSNMFKTKVARMGKIICLRPSRIDYYGSDGRIASLAWTE